MGSTKIQGEKSRESGLEAQIKALHKYVPSIVRTAIARDPQRPSPFSFFRFTVSIKDKT